MYTNNQGDRGAGTDINLCNGSPTCFCLTVVDQVESGVMIVIYRYAQPGSDSFVQRISRSKLKYMVAQLVTDPPGAKSRMR